MRRRCHRWLEKAVAEASQSYFKAPPAYMGRAARSVHGMLGDKFPGAQFLVTAWLGLTPTPTAERFIHLPTGKR